MRDELIRGVFYRVREGDTLSEIIDRFLPGHWTNWDHQVSGMNGLKGSMIFPNQLLQLPDQAREPTYCKCCGKPY